MDGPMRALQKRIDDLQLGNWRRKIATGQEVWLAGYADASYKGDEPYRGASWGLWVRDHNLRILRAGLCPDWVMGKHGVAHAELYGVYEAVITSLERLDSKTCNILVVKNDNAQVCDWFGARGGGHYPTKAEACGLVIDAYERCAAADVRLIVKKVKGHAGKGTTQGYLNHRVDRMAWDARVKRRPSEWVGEIEKPDRPQESEHDRIQWMHRKVGELLMLNHFTVIDNRLAQIEPDKDGLEYSVAVLEATLAAKSKLPSHQALRDRVATALQARGEDPKDTLRGL